MNTTKNGSVWIRSKPSILLLSILCPLVCSGQSFFAEKYVGGPMESSLLGMLRNVSDIHRSVRQNPSGDVLRQPISDIPRNGAVDTEADRWDWVESDQIERRSPKDVIRIVSSSRTKSTDLFCDSSAFLCDNEEVEAFLCGSTMRIRVPSNYTHYTGIYTPSDDSISWTVFVHDDCQFEVDASSWINTASSESRQVLLGQQDTGDVIYPTILEITLEQNEMISYEASVSYDPTDPFSYTLSEIYIGPNSRAARLELTYSIVVSIDSISVEGYTGSCPITFGIDNENLQTWINSCYDSLCSGSSSYNIRVYYRDSNQFSGEFVFPVTILEVATACASIVVDNNVYLQEVLIDGNDIDSATISPYKSFSMSFSSYSASGQEYSLAKMTQTAELGGESVPISCFGEEWSNGVLRIDCLISHVLASASEVTIITQLGISRLTSKSISADALLSSDPLENTEVISKTALLIGDEYKYLTMSVGGYRPALGSSVSYDLGPVITNHCGVQPVDTCVLTGYGVSYKDHIGCELALRNASETCRDIMDFIHVRPEVEVSFSSTPSWSTLRWTPQVKQDTDDKVVFYVDSTEICVAHIECYSDHLCLARQRYLVCEGRGDLVGRVDLRVKELSAETTAGLFILALLASLGSLSSCILFIAASRLKAAKSAVVFLLKNLGGFEVDLDSDILSDKTARSETSLA